MPNKKWISLIIVFIFLFSVNFAFAACSNQTQSDGTVVKLCNPLGEGKTDIPTFLGTVINYVMGIIGSLALVMFIYGGLTWMLSGGSQEQVSKGKNVIIWATLGLAIIFVSYALVKFVILAISEAT